MNLNFNGIQSDNNHRTITAQARHLMSANRQRLQHRTQAMLNRTAAEVGLDS